jgi:hypothetical protein
MAGEAWTKWSAINYMQKAISLFLLFAIWLVPMRGQAQSSVTIESLKVELWPEYDQPSMLVIYRFTLSADTSLPAQLRIRIPTAAGEPFALAVGPSLDQVGDVPHSRSFTGEWAEISFVATMPAVQLEYYDPGLTKEGSDRSFEYRWSGDYPVRSLVVDVQQPVDAIDMLISPSLGNGQVRADGLTYYTSQVGSLESMQSFSINLAYQKPNDDLSISRLQVAPSQPLTVETSGRVEVENLLPWGLGLLGLALIGGGGFWYWQSTRQDARSQPKATARGKRWVSPQALDEEESSEISVYCHQCGKRAAPGDRFCRSCGTRLRL